MLIIEKDGRENVYDFTVDEVHNFYINDTLVHNCAEILLRPHGFCNLSTTVIRANDTFETLQKKVRLASIIGTLQATLTDFPYIRSIWKKNAEEEALLGCSFTGIMDHPVMSGDAGEDLLIEWLEGFKKTVNETNIEIAGLCGINPAAASTTVKPEGTVSQLTDTGSGIHDRFSDFYIRRVRGDKKDPLTQFMESVGFPCETDIVNPSNMVFSFPIASPIKQHKNRSAIEQLNHWKLYKDHWAEHSVSVTIYYDDDEFLGVGQWVWDNFDSITGISFLPKSNHIYQQAPYEEIDELKYNELMARMPINVDWSGLSEYEKDDTTTGTQTLACSSGVCEIVDIGNAS